MLKKLKNPYLGIIGVAIVLLLPQLFTRNMIMGSDIIFHFNRFYDTAMQLKTRNIDYFIAMFGFSQSGRIVNALYGPIMAYIQGGILLLAKTWFNYQVLSNFCLYVLSGISMFQLLRKTTHKKWYSFWLAVIFMTTFCIQYWIQRQGFTSWGVAILPWCLMPIKRMMEHKKLNWFSIGVGVAAMFQIHMFTSLQLVLIYAGFFVVCWVTANKGERIQLLFDLLKSIALFIVLTANIIVSYFQIYSTNTLAEPFLNDDMNSTAVNVGNLYWLVTPYFLLVLFALWVAVSIGSWSKTTVTNRTAIGISLVFLLLSTTIVPWNELLNAGVPFIRLIQFPFRFFVPFTVLLFYSLALGMSDLEWQTQKVVCIFAIGGLCAMLQVMWTNYQHLQYWNQKDLGNYLSLHVRLDDDREKVRASAYSTDLDELLQLWQKSTPDYIPIIGKGPNNNYRGYEAYIFESQKGFEKTISPSGDLMITWTATDTVQTDVPVFKYADTELFLNGNQLVSGQYDLSPVGTVAVTPQVGINELTVKYISPRGFLESVIITVIGWLFVLAWFMTITFWPDRGRTMKQVTLEKEI